MYDELQLPKKPPAKVPPYPNRYGKNKLGDANTSSDHTLAGSVSSKPNCIMNDSQQHNLWECPKFLSMNVENRLSQRTWPMFFMPWSTTLVESMSPKEEVWSEWLFEVPPCSPA